MFGASIYVAIATSIGLLFLVARAVYDRFFHPLSGIPGPFLAGFTRLWLVYQTYQCRRHVLDPGLHAKYGPYVRIAPNELLVSDINYFPILYGAGTKFNKSAWYSALTDGDHTFNLLAETDTHLYWQQRRLISPVFTTQALRRYQTQLARAVGAFVEKMSSKANEPQDLVKWMNILALDVLTEMTFSCDPGYISSEDDGGNCTDIDNFWRFLSWIGLLPAFHLGYKRARALLEAIGLNVLYKADTGKLSIIQVSILLASHRLELIDMQFYIREIVARGNESLEQRRSHCDIASGMEHARIDKPELKTEWANIMLLHIVGAGFDTVGTTLASCISFISETPNCQSRLAQEVASIEVGEFEHETLMRTPYLQACLKETMRLRPVVATSMSRTVPAQGLWIAGRWIPPGTVIGMNPVVLHRTREVFGDDADNFRPERWLEAEGVRHQQMEMYTLAFGSPARSCPGKNLAWMILCRTVAELIRHLSIQILPPDEVKRRGLPAFSDATFFVYKIYNVWAEFGRREKSQE